MISCKFFYVFLFWIFLLGFVSSADCFPNYVCGEWSACENGLTTRTCIDSKCGAENIIERELCGEEKCEPDISCGEWSSCNYFDKTSDIINEEIIFEGIKERICSDKANCIDSFVEKEGCSLAIPVKVRRAEWCGEQLVEILNEDGNVVGRIKQTEVTKKFRRVDISLVEESLPTYCSYCYDGVKNYDEEDVDCGGLSCPACIAKIEFVDWAYFISLLSWGIFILMFFVGLVFLSRNESFSEGLKNLFYFFKPLTREEALAREEKIKEFVLQKKISSEGFKNY
jgi:hypothetical protein